jgi:hypothetical protein
VDQPYCRHYVTPTNGVVVTGYTSGATTFGHLMRWSRHTDYRTGGTSSIGVATRVEGGVNAGETEVTNDVDEKEELKRRSTRKEMRHMNDNDDTGYSWTSSASPASLPFTGVRPINTSTRNTTFTYNKGARKGRGRQHQIEPKKVGTTTPSATTSVIRSSTSTLNWCCVSHRSAPNTLNHTFYTVTTTTTTTPDSTAIKASSTTQVTWQEHYRVIDKYRRSRAAIRYFGGRQHMVFLPATVTLVKLCRGKINELLGVPLCHELPGELINIVMDYLMFFD